MIWLALAMTAILAAVLAATILPIVKGARAAPERARYDRAVYRDQLTELERDLARGVLREEEAAAARIEIERRLLATDVADTHQPSRATGNPALAISLAILVGGGAFAAYLHFGAPLIPDAPYASRASERAMAGMTDRAEMEKNAAALEDKLRADPANKDGWLLLARTAAALGDWQKSAEAYRRLRDLVPDNTVIASSQGEMLVMAAQGIVTPAAHEAFAAAARGNPDDQVARFYLALADAQAGNSAAAIAAWLKLAGEIQQDSPMRAEIARRIATAAAASGMQAPPLPPPALATASDTDIANFARLSPAQRTEMVRAMVGQLEARLKTNPGDIEGWVRLGRAYLAMGEPDKASNAYDRAAQLKPEDVSIPLQEIDVLLAGQDPAKPIPDRALALLHRVEAMDANQPEALWYLGFAAAQARRVDEATRYWEKLSAQLPEGSDDRKKVGLALDALKGK